MGGRSGLLPSFDTTHQGIARGAKHASNLACSMAMVDSEWVLGFILDRWGYLAAQVTTVTARFLEGFKLSLGYTEQMLSIVTHPQLSH
jgi:hypothetical protein